MISRKRLKEKFKEKQYRDAYVKRSNREYIAYKIRKIRGTKTQTEFAGMLGTSHSVISRLENPNYEGITLNTITEIAATHLGIWSLIVFRRVRYLATTKGIGRPRK